MKQIFKKVNDIKLKNQSSTFFVIRYFSLDFSEIKEIILFLFKNFYFECYHLSLKLQTETRRTKNNKGQKVAWAWNQDCNDKMSKTGTGLKNEPVGTTTKARIKNQEVWIIDTNLELLFQGFRASNCCAQDKGWRLNIFRPV